MCLRECGVDDVCGDRVGEVRFSRAENKYCQKLTLTGAGTG